MQTLDKRNPAGTFQSVTHRARVHVVVVGAGVGGLAAAIDLATRGAAVTVCEQGDSLGGKIRTARVHGRSVDAGPTVLTMRWVFDELWRDSGARLEDSLVLAPLETIARHTWPDGTRLDLTPDVGRNRDAIAHAFGDAEGARYVAFAEDAKALFELVNAPFLASDRPSWKTIVKHTASMGVRALGRVDAHRSMWRSLQDRFRDPRLVQLFARYATYAGTSPFDAPATLNVISHVERLGVYRVEGGMVALASAMARRARELGVEFEIGSRVARVLVADGRVTGVSLADGRAKSADGVVFNGDITALAEGALGEEAGAAARAPVAGRRSFSAVTWAMVGTVKGAPLVRHNVFFARDATEEFDALRRGVVPSEPTVYVAAQDRADSDESREEERLLVIVNAPATGDDPSAWTEAVRERCKTGMLRVLERGGVTITPSGVTETTPHEFASRYPSTAGALYGPPMTGALSPLARSAARTKVRGLVLAGGSVHPGAGVPMATLSGRRAARALAESLGLTRPYPTEATAGTTSMVTATMTSEPSSSSP
jgi:1-hydroxycarotenoid 3,4-desaturase